MSFAKKTVQTLDCAGKRVLMRVDFNVPTKNGEVADASRIEAAMPTIRYLLQKGARLVLCSHLGRPKGGPEAKYSMQPVRAKLERLLRQNVAWADDCVGSAAEAASRALKDATIERAYKKYGAYAGLVFWLDVTRHWHENGEDGA